MPTGQYLNNKTLDQAVRDGTIKVSTINDKVRRILWVMFKLGLFDHTTKPDPKLVNSKENQQIALKTEKEGIVLFKNKNDILPLNLHKTKSIAVIGTSAEIARVTGGGSAMITPYFSVNPLQAMRREIGNKAELQHAPGVTLDSDVHPINPDLVYSGPGSKKHGWKAEYFDSNDFQGKPQITRIDKKIDFQDFGQVSNLNISASKFQHGFSVRWNGYVVPQKSQDYIFDVTSNNGFRLYLNGKLVQQGKRGFPMNIETYRVHLEAQKKYHVRLDYYQAVPGMNIFFVHFGWRTSNKERIQKAVDLAAH